MEGRLGLAAARIPHKDRHGILWLARGKLSVSKGCLRFECAGYEDIEPGTYQIPYQSISAIVLLPGTSLTHDVLRICARHSVLVVASGTAGSRFYASLPAGPDRSDWARAQARLWSDRESARRVARRMYAMRMGEVFPSSPLDVLRGLEGARVKKTYRVLADKYGVLWKGRRFDRGDPQKNDRINDAINHASAAVVAAAQVAVAITSTIPQLGFIHEDSRYAFALDIADLFREELTLETAFSACARFDSRRNKDQSLERFVRGQTTNKLVRKEVVPKMIDKIKLLVMEKDEE